MMTKFEPKIIQKDYSGGATESVLVMESVLHGDVKISRAVSVWPSQAWAEQVVTLTREQAAHVAAELTRWLEETAPVDPAYEAYAEKSAAAIPATDNEWKDRLVEGGVA